MRRAYLVEFSVLAHYLRQLVFIGLVVSVCLVLGMQSIGAVPAGLTMMILFGFTMSSCAYDDQNGWGMYRLTLPLSRRDVVLGRYAAVLTAGVAAAVLSTALCAAVAAVASRMPLPGEVRALLLLGDGGLGALVGASAACFLMGSIIMGVCLPAFFKFGTTKATQFMPFIVLAALVVPLALVNMLGDGVMEAVRAALSVLDTPEGLAMGATAAVAVAVAVVGASLALSIRFYEKREL